MNTPNITLSMENLQHPQNWPQGYRLPAYDVEQVAKQTKETPTWLHMGAGNIFRIFVAGLQHDLLEAGHAQTGIIVYEPYDEGIIPASFSPYDNLTLAVSLLADGNTKKRVIASVADVFYYDIPRLMELVAKPCLQLITFTITEKGYTVPANICASPSTAKAAMEQVTAGLYARFQASAPPMALVTMDNFAENGTVVAKAVEKIATAWHLNGQVPAKFIDYVKAQSFPWTMIDKITPSPSKVVAELLEKEGYQSTKITETQKHTTIASFVNAEAPQYLVIEDAFPNGRPPLEKAGKHSGVFFTDQETVRKADQMKVCACLNPLHTVLGVCGSLLGLPTIAACMQDMRLVALIRHSAKEAMPTVADPGILNPQEFLHEVVTQRFPNPFIPDTPYRINMDNSQKISIRFGETLKARQAKGLDITGLEAIPRFIALWLRFRMGIDDTGTKMELSPDPDLPKAVLPLLELKLGETTCLAAILSDKSIFGVDLYEVGLANKIEELFAQLAEKPGAVGRLLSMWYDT